MTRPSLTRRALKGVAVFLLLVFTLFPTYWMLVSAVDENPSGGAELVPRQFTLDHFVYVLTDGGFATFLSNSAVVALVVVVVSGCSASWHRSPSPASASHCGRRSS